MKNENSYAQIKQIARLKNILEVKRNLNLEKDICSKFFLTYDYCLNSLKKKFRELLLNSYFELDYKFWWADTYSQSAYYRARAKAVISFVNLFNLIYENFPYFSRFIIRNHN